jgi:hypothetical protein
LAAVSVDHYTRLEQGRVTAASDNILAGIARALRLTHDEHAYLRMLAQPLYRARTTRTVCELAFCGCRAGSGAWLFDCCT